MAAFRFSLRLYRNLMVVYLTLPLKQITYGNSPVTAKMCTLKTVNLVKDSGKTNSFFLNDRTTRQMIEVSQSAQ